MVVDTLLLNMPKDLMKPDLSSYEMMQFISNLAISGGLLMILWTKEQPERRVWAYDSVILSLNKF